MPLFGTVTVGITAYFGGRLRLRLRLRLPAKDKLAVPQEVAVAQRLLIFF